MTIALISIAVALASSYFAPLPARRGSCATASTAVMMAGQENQIEEELAFTDDGGWAAWATAHGVEAPKLAVR